MIGMVESARLFKKLIADVCDHLFCVPGHLNAEDPIHAGAFQFFYGLPLPLCSAGPLLSQTGTRRIVGYQQVVVFYILTL